MCEVAVRDSGQGATNASVLRQRFLCSVLAICAQFMVFPAQAADPVGVVSFVIGKAVVENEANADAKTPVVSGLNIYPGDKVKTSSSGHVHIRFIDEGLVSLRPKSMLSIEDYQFDSTNPASSTIRFKLVEGVVRSISGQGAKASRDKFRLNTPIAAIGVRGTDFVVQANSEAVRAVVNEGAIVVAPFSTQCAVDGLGPCDFNGVELDDLSKKMLEITAGSERPLLVPIPNKFIPNLIEKYQDSEESETSNQDNGAGAGVQTAGADNQAGAGGQSEEGSGGLGSVGKPQVEYADSLVNQESSLTEIIDEANGTLNPSNFMPDEPVALEELDSRKLVWGRWDNLTVETDRIVAVRNEIVEGRKVAVGFGDYVLYRTDEGTAELQAGLGSVEFSLNDAQAVLHGSNGAEPMQVREGRLSIDFNQHRYSTGLELNHEDTSTVEFVSSGSINDKGYFNNRTDTSRLTGATAFDGSEASYLFSQQHELGNIEGITFWKARE